MSEDHDQGVTHLPQRTCPHCGYLFTAAGTVDGSEGREPRRGDPIVCLNCAEILVFTSPTELRALTPNENKRVLANKPAWREARAAQALVRQAQAGSRKTAFAERGGRPN